MGYFYQTGRRNGRIRGTAVNKTHHYKIKLLLPNVAILNDLEIHVFLGLSASFIRVSLIEKNGDGNQVLRASCRSFSFKSATTGS